MPPKRRTRPKTASRTPRFTRIRLANWRNFRSVDVRLQNRAFLVGPNAAGKSNFLDAFRFLKDVASVGGGFQDAVRTRGGVSLLRCLAAKRYPDVTLDVTIGNDDHPREWEYLLSFNQDQQRRVMIRSEIVKRRGQILVERPDDDDRADPFRLSQTHLEQVYANKRYRVVQEFLKSIRYLHIVPQLVREPDRSVGRVNDPFGGDFLEQIAKTHSRTRDARLRKIRDALTVALPQLEQLELYRDPADGTPHLRGKYQHWRPQGAWQTEEQFSDGTLRLLGLLWAILERSGPLLLEEPELSLHPEVVTYIPHLFARTQRQSGRQVLVSTHSPDLLQDEGIRTDEVLLLRPTPEGTEVHPSSKLRDIQALLHGGSTLGDIVMPRSGPSNASQLSLFGK